MAATWCAWRASAASRSTATRTAAPPAERIIDGRAVLSRWMMRLLLLVLCGVALTGPAAAEARSGSCLVPGVKIKCSIWTGKVTYIGDGDTVYVRVDGFDPPRTVSVRFTGINAMEQTVYSSNPAARRGACH